MLGLHALTALILTAVAYRLLRNRDVGAGLLAERAGRATAPGGWAGPSDSRMAAAQRGALMTWTIGLGLYALLAGSVVDEIGGEIGDSPGSATSSTVSAVPTHWNGRSSRSRSASSVSAPPPRRSWPPCVCNEKSARGPDSARRRGQQVPLGGKPWCLPYWERRLPVTAGLVAGLATASRRDVRATLSRVLAAAAVQLPVVWLMASIAWRSSEPCPASRRRLGCTGRCHRAVSPGFGCRDAAVGAGPQSVHPVPGCPVNRCGRRPLLWMSAASGVLTVLGLTGLRRRDLR